jgi:hypothetical protein
MSYDIFISYRVTHKAWVEALARNLQAQGYRVFLDMWALRAGESWAAQLYQALQDASYGVIVVTPDVIDSGWVKDEWDTMLQRKNSGKPFKMIPLLAGGQADLPFMKNIQYVDFTRHEAYSESFYCLMCGLKGVEPGPDRAFDKDIEIPEPLVFQTVSSHYQTDSILPAIFERLFHPRTVMVLSQADFGVRPVVDALFEQAGLKYGRENTHFIAMPVVDDDDTDNFFANIAMQCGLPDSVNCQSLFERAFIQKLNTLKAGSSLFILISGFENGSETARKELAGVLRNISSRPASHVRMALFGGERLAELKFRYGDHSLLSHADVHEWPELSVPEVLAIQKEQYPDMAIDEKTAMTLLKVSGGHPLLLDRCLALWHEAKDSTESDYYEALVDDSAVWQLITPFLNDPSTVARMCEFLKNEELCPYRSYIHDDLIRKLYWKNLITKRGKGRHRSLFWRCSAIIEVGRMVLQC